MSLERYNGWKERRDAARERKIRDEIRKKQEREKERVAEEGRGRETQQ